MPLHVQLPVFPGVPQGAEPRRQAETNPPSVVITGSADAESTPGYHRESSSSAYGAGG